MEPWTYSRNRFLVVWKNVAKKRRGKQDEEIGNTNRKVLIEVCFHISWALHLCFPFANHSLQGSRYWIPTTIHTLRSTLRFGQECQAGNDYESETVRQPGICYPVRQSGTGYEMQMKG